SESSGDDTLRGIGCASGRVTAHALVVHDPRDDLDAGGRILVTHTTDPGWVFLMVAAAGLVAEKGSALSHTAIIGRELGIPTVVGVEGATRRIAHGQRVEIDGRCGTVRILPSDGRPNKPGTKRERALETRQFSVRNPLGVAPRLGAADFEKRRDP